MNDLSLKFLKSENVEMQVNYPYSIKYDKSIYK